MNNNFRRISAALLAGIMILSLSACGKPDDSSSDVEIVYEEQIVYESAAPSGSENTVSDGSSSTSSDANQSGNQSTGKTPSGSTVNNADKYKGKTVRYATWKDPKLNEDGPVVESFQKKTGIKVKVDLYSQGEYVNKIAGLIASGNQPDVFFCNSTFPAAMSCLQPIDKMELDLNDPIWDKDMLELSKVNGKSYLVNTVGNIWNEVDMVFYNKKLLKDNHITTPEEYYNAGKWNFEALKKVMNEVNALGDGYSGAYINVDSLLGAAGAGYYKFQNGKFVNGMDAKLTSVMTTISELNKSGAYTGAVDAFVKGKTGISITNAFGLKKTGYFSKMNTDHIGFTYLPSYDANTPAKTAALFRGWGLVKGAKEPGAAGVFLRYYLDVNNYDTSKAFISKEAESFFFKVTNVKSSSKFYYFTEGACGVTGETYRDFTLIPQKDPAQIATILQSMKNTVNSNVKKLNQYIDKHTK